MFKTRFLVSFAIIALMLGEVSMRPLISVSAQGQTFVYPAALIDGRSAGNLILGQTVVEQAVKMFPSAPPGYEGNPRPPRGFPEAKIGQVSPKPTLVYNPWMTLYLLFFDANQKLVIVVDGGKSRFRGLSQQEMLRQYPQLKETSRGSLESPRSLSLNPRRLHRLAKPSCSALRVANAWNASRGWIKTRSLPRSSTGLIIERSH